MKQNNYLMECYHEQEMTYLIGHKWDLQEMLSDQELSKEERFAIQKQLTDNIDKMAAIVDFYQNTFIRFHLQGTTYAHFSDIVKNPSFDFAREKQLLKRIFELCNATCIQHIQIEDLEKETGDSYKVVLV